MFTHAIQVQSKVHVGEHESLLYLLATITLMYNSQRQKQDVVNAISHAVQTGWPLTSFYGLFRTYFPHLLYEEDRMLGYGWHEGEDLMTVRSGC